ncbi:MAG: ATP-binding protein [Gemmatimonadota bacterium]|nr:ATP-binding protein [Gemmatimonadota bacterium]
MNSIRARLTMAYAAALLGTMLAFAIALFNLRRAGQFDELQRSVVTEANLALNLIRQTEQAGQKVTILTDSILGPTISPTLRSVLEGVPDYLLVLDRDSRSLYISFAARQLIPDDLAELQVAAFSAPTGGTARAIVIGGERLLIAAAEPTEAGSTIARVSVATSLRSSELALQDLARSMLTIAPLLLIASLGIAYVIAGRVFDPVHRIINEVQAITDGRSLHRRLPLDETAQEMASLTITLNEMIERLEKSFSALRRFTADASHELKTPLTVLRADVERAMSSNATRTEKMVALEEALQETTRMADLVESLLTLARADEGRFDLHLERVEMEPLTLEVAETALILGEAAGLNVSVPTVEQATVMGDPTRLRQLCLNLATNAIKYTPRGGSVEISLTCHESSVVFSVRDTGVGISAADLPHVFERFYRADRARPRSAERGGFGLGLAISQWIAEAHGGTISVRSRLTRGSTFTVTLPLVDVSEEALSFPPPEMRTA